MELAPEDKARTRALACRLLAAPDLETCVSIMTEANETLNEPGYVQRIVELIGALLGGYLGVVSMLPDETRALVRDRFAMVAEANELAGWDVSFDGLFDGPE